MSYMKTCEVDYQVAGKRLYFIGFIQGVGPQEYTIIKMKVIEPFKEKLG